MHLRYLLAERCDAIRSAPDAVPRDVAARRLMDGVGVLLRGNATVSARIAYRFLGIADRPPLAQLGEAATLAGADRGRAGFAYGVAAGANNWADTSLRSLAHPGAAVVPAVLAAASPRWVPWGELATAIAAGYEAMEIVGRALNDGVPRLSSQLAGFRSAAMCGAFGTIGALTVLDGLSTELSADAFGIACDLVGGLTRQVRGPDSAIRMQAGSSVRAGFEAVALAQAGVRSAPDVFEAEDGFLSAHHARPAALPAVSPQWHVRDAAQKFHCAPHNFATALDVIRGFAADDGIDNSAPPVHVEVRTPQEHLDLARSSAGFPDTPAQAALNLRYGCARVLLTGDFLWPEELAAGLRDDHTRGVFDRIDVIGDETLGARLEEDRGVWPALVRVTAADGQVIERRADEPFGARFDDRVAAAGRVKFERDAAAGGLRSGCADALLAAIEADQPVVDVLFEVVRSSL